MDFLLFQLPEATLMALPSSRKPATQHLSDSSYVFISLWPAGKSSLLLRTHVIRLDSPGPPPHLENLNLSAPAKSLDRQHSHRVRGSWPGHLWWEALFYRPQLLTCGPCWGMPGLDSPKEKLINGFSLRSGGKQSWEPENGRFPLKMLFSDSWGKSSGLICGASHKIRICTELLWNPFLHHQVHRLTWYFWKKQKWSLDHCPSLFACLG